MYSFELGINATLTGLATAISRLIDGFTAPLMGTFRAFSTFSALFFGIPA